MPILRNRMAFEVARGVKAFLNVEAGITRGAGPQPLPIEDAPVHAVANGSGGGIRPENVVWIFGTARVGSTWLGAMMDDLQGQAVWHEPLVGELFGHLYYVRGRSRRDENFILGGKDESYLRSIRAFVMTEANAKFPELGPNGYLVVKEPNGSIGAPLLAGALPESRLILLVRDPRDVAASALDANKGGSWHDLRKKNAGNTKVSPADKNPDAFIRSKADKYLQFVGNSKEAYDAHEGPKALVRYEELVADTLGTMRRLFSELGLPVEEGELSAVVEKHSWENIPQEKKGEGKFYRKGEPGSWREDLTPKQAQIVERVTEPLLKEFYPR